MVKPPLTLRDLKEGSRQFVQAISRRGLRDLFGVTDGKAVGTYIERRFHEFLGRSFSYTAGNAAVGIDFPQLGVDVKVTSIRQPQSSCPYSAASQKVYDLGYHLLVFVYEKTDDRRSRTARLNFLHAIFVNRAHTADYQTTNGILDILNREGNRDDITAFLEEKNLPLDEIGRGQLADRILSERPNQGYLTVSNALQWRLQYGRIVTISQNGGNEGVENLLRRQA